MWLGVSVCDEEGVPVCDEDGVRLAVDDAVGVRLRVPENIEEVALPVTVEVGVAPLETDGEGCSTATTPAAPPPPCAQYAH